MSDNNNSVILRKRARYKSFMGQVAASRSRLHILLFIPAMICAFLLDVLNSIKSFILWLIVLILALILIFGFYGYTKVKPIYDEYNAVAEDIVNNSTVDSFRPLESTYIYDVSGNTLAKLRGDQDAIYLVYNDIPTDAVNAFIAVEDRTFWDNPGIDTKGMIRVAKNLVQSSGDEVHGASTITQQLVRNIFLTKEVSLERKIKEILIALKLTKKYSKKDIMEFYVNNIYYANNFYGLESASHGYFSKNASDLTLSQLAYVCSIPNSPEYYNPYKHPERAIERRDKILHDMLEENFITKQEYDTAINEEIVIKKQEYKFNDYLTTYAVDCATKWLMERNGFNFRYDFVSSSDYRKYKNDYDESYEANRHELVTSGYKIYTSLDADVQSNLQQILNEKLAFDDEVNMTTGEYALQGAITVVDNNTRKVIAVVGGRDASESNDKDVIYTFNRAYQSARQPGSTIKPLVVYTPALMNGYNTETTVYNIDVDEAKDKNSEEVQKMRGEALSLRRALERSLNGVAWQIFDKLKASYCLTFLQEMEFASICPDDFNNASALGGLTNGVSTVEMAEAYSTLENHGEYQRATCITKIIDRTGNQLYSDVDSKQVYTAKAADTMVDMMTGVLKSGTAAQLNWYKSTDMVAACKTGTTNGSKDGWLCGFTPYYTVAVWVGYDQPRTLNNLWGATYPGQIWKASMLYLIDGKETVESFKRIDIADDGTYSLPENAYDKYLEGRENDEILSDGYTVGNYREDRVKGETITALTNQIKSAPDAATAQDLYSQAQSELNTIQSRKYKNELSSALNSAYNAKVNPAPTVPQVPVEQVQIPPVVEQQPVPAVDPSLQFVPQP